MSQATLAQFAGISREALDELTNAERKAYVACRVNEVGIREQARFSGRSSGTVGNLLRRAEAKRLDLGFRRTLVGLKQIRYWVSSAASRRCCTSA